MEWESHRLDGMQEIFHISIEKLGWMTNLVNMAMGKYFSWSLDGRKQMMSGARDEDCAA